MITVRQRETYTAYQWSPGETVPGVGLHTVVSQGQKYLLQTWPGGDGYCFINPGEWVLIASGGHRFILDDETFRRSYVEVQP